LYTAIIPALKRLRQEHQEASTGYIVVPCLKELKGKKDLKIFINWALWLMPVILATQEAEIRKTITKKGC
jgi:hypothetical protein